MNSNLFILRLCCYIVGGCVACRDFGFMLSHALTYVLTFVHHIWPILHKETMCFPSFLFCFAAILEFHFISFQKHILNTNFFYLPQCILKYRPHQQEVHKYISHMALLQKSQSLFLDDVQHHTFAAWRWNCSLLFTNDLSDIH